MVHSVISVLRDWPAMTIEPLSPHDLAYARCGFVFFGCSFLPDNDCKNMCFKLVNSPAGSLTVVFVVLLLIVSRARRRPGLKKENKLFQSDLGT